MHPNSTTHHLGLPPMRQAQPPVVCICCLAQDLSLDRSWSMAAAAAVYASGGAKQAYGRQAWPQRHSDQCNHHPREGSADCVVIKGERKRRREGRERARERLKQWERNRGMALWRDAEGCKQKRGKVPSSVQMIVLSGRLSEFGPLLRHFWPRPHYNSTERMSWPVSCKGEKSSSSETDSKGQREKNRDGRRERERNKRPLGVLASFSVQLWQWGLQQSGQSRQHVAEHPSDKAHRTASSPIPLFSL